MHGIVKGKGAGMCVIISLHSLAPGRKARKCQCVIFVDTVTHARMMQGNIEDL